MSALSPPRVRHPLGLPPGSIRAILALLVLGNIWARLLLPQEKTTGLPQYLYYLMFLIVGCYFATRSHHPAGATGEWPPLYLPRGTIRFIIIAGFAAVLGWGFYQDPENFGKRLQPSPEEPQLAFLPFAIIGAFLVGVIVGRLSHRLLWGPTGLPAWFQDVQAWISLIAVVLLVIDTLIQLVIYPNVSEGLRVPLHNWQYILTAVIAFYFGVRS
ncbi:MAG TPA: hypothetical protein VKI65_01390 [Gemmataceae bacterium]|nr:hypothetical protein [Gemmataceae bacterium]